MRTCKNCKFWGVDYENVCDRVYPFCDELKPDTFSINVVAGDNQGVEDFLVTGPDFGCLHFMQKNPMSTENDD